MPPLPSKDDDAVPAAGYARLPVQRWRDGDGAVGDDYLAEEVPVALIYNGQPHVVMMATPSDLEAFAIGFSLSEAIVTRPDAVTVRAITTHDNGYEIALQIPEARHAALADRRRNLVGRSGCGLCGSETIAEAMRPPRRVPAGLVIETTALVIALDALRAQQTINGLTGATHAAAWAEPDGSLRAVCEDVGRHNALDKLIGTLVQQGLDPSRGFAVITSRASYEMVLKASTVGIPMVVAISAPTALAVRLAEEAGLTLVGFARARNHVVYACPARLNHPIQTQPLETRPA